jgi:hypothetical protein
MKSFVSHAGTVLFISMLAASLATAQAPRPPQSASERLSGNFADINRKVLEMAEDFPADKYGFRLKPEMRTFGEVIVHVASGVVYAAKAGMGEKANWDELDAKNYRTKADIVALMKKSIADSNAAIKKNPEGPTKNLDPFLSVMEHSAEHYGLLVAYYRANGLVPPESRPKGK